MIAPALEKPAPTMVDRDANTIRELRCRRQLAFDEERILDRLDELFKEHDDHPTRDTAAALLKAANALKVDGRRRVYATVVRSVQSLTGKPVVLVCDKCGHRVISQLAGKVTCLACARTMRLRARHAEEA